MPSLRIALITPVQRRLGFRLDPVMHPLSTKPASRLGRGDHLLIAYPKTHPRRRYRVLEARQCGRSCVRVSTTSLYRQPVLRLAMTLPSERPVEVVS